MATSLRELIVSVSADTTKYQREMDRASRMGAQYFRTVQEGGRTAGRSWDAQTAAARTHAGALEASTQAISRYAAVAASAFGVSRLIGLADEYGQISSRIRLATESTEDFENAQSRLVDIASRTYRQYGEAADQFAATAVAMREMGFATNDTLDAAEALGLALVAGGANVQRGAAANDAWAKSMVQGRIATDQFQTLLLQTPRVIQALGDGLGKTTQELQEMASKGELTARVVVPAITSQIGRLSAEVESMPTTLEDAGIRFRNELQRWVGEANASSGATQVLVGGLEILADHIDTLVTVGGAAALGALTGKLIQMGQATATAAVSMVQSRAAAIAEAVAIRDATLAGQLKAQSDLRRAQAAMGATRGTAASAAASRNLASALLTERQATLAAAQAQANYLRATSATAMAGRAALGVLGGPAGLAITVGMVAAGWLMFRDNTDAATSALDNWTGSADEAVAKFRELNAEQQRGAILNLEDSIGGGLEEVNRQINQLAADLSNLGAGGAVWDNFITGAEQLRERLAAGKITADEFSRGMSELNDRVVTAVGGGGDLARQLDLAEAAMATAAREVDVGRERLARFNTENSSAAAQANATAGALRGQAGAMVELGEESRKAYEKIQNGVRSLPGQIARLGKNAGQVAAMDVRDVFRSMAADGVNFSDRSNPQVQQAIAEAAEYIRLQSELEAGQKRVAAATREASKAQKEARVSAADEYLADLNEGYAQQVQSLERQIALYGTLGRSAAMAYDLANGALSGLAEEQRAYLQEMSEWLDDQDALTKVWEETANEHAKYTEKSKKTVTGLEAYADQAARNMQTALGDQLYNVLDGKFSGIADSFSQMLKRMAAEMLASELWQALGTALSGYGGQGGWGDFLRGVGGAMSGTKTDGGRAGGGQVSPWSAYDVTEHGDPEILRIGGRQVLLTGSKGGMVSPLMQRDGGAGGQPPQLNVTIVKGANEDRVEEPMANKNGGFDLRIFMKSEIQRTFAGGDMDDTLRMMGVPLNRGGR